MVQSDFLSRIIERKRERLAEARAARSLEDVRREAFDDEGGRAAARLARVRWKTRRA